jgi:hypothetical protein
MFTATSTHKIRRLTLEVAEGDVTMYRFTWGANGTPWTNNLVDACSDTAMTVNAAPERVTCSQVRAVLKRRRAAARKFPVRDS